MTQQTWMIPRQTRRLPLCIALLVFVSLFTGVFVLWRQQSVILEMLDDYYRVFIMQPTQQPSEKSQETVISKSFKYVSSLCNCGKNVKVIDEEESSKNPKPLFDWCSPESSVRGKHQKVITYVLYGKTTDAAVFKRYYSYLNDIAETAEKEYPGWNVRIYHNFTEDSKGTPEDRAAHDQLCGVYCKFQHVDLCSLPLMIKRIGDNNRNPVDPALLQGLNPRMLRYLAMLDPNVDIFMSRDVDSIIWRREVDAVEEWLRSNYTFHLMRDHQSHGVIILAGKI